MVNSCKKSLGLLHLPLLYYPTSHFICPGADDQCHDVEYYKHI